MYTLEGHAVFFKYSMVSGWEQELYYNDKLDIFYRVLHLHSNAFSLEKSEDWRVDLF